MVKHYRRVITAMVVSRNAQLAGGAFDSRVFTGAMLVVFGEPSACLFCGTDIIAQRERMFDIDAWFCSDHCPACNGIDAVTN